MSNCSFLAGVVAVVLATVPPHHCEAATTRYVSPAGSETSPYTSWATAAKTIQPAVDASVGGDIILVTNGVYAVTRHIAVNKGVTVIGLGGASGTIIDGGGVSRGFFLSHSNAVVDGFWIRNGRSGEGWNSAGGVIVWSNALVRNCVISNCVAAYAAGAFLVYGGNIRNCLIVSNTVLNPSDQGGGVMIQNGGTVENCTIVGNKAPFCAGVCFNIGTGNKVINSIIYGNLVGANVGYYNTNTSSGSISYSCFTPHIAGAGNITAPPPFVEGYHIAVSSPCINGGTNLPWMADATDLAGNPRILNHAVDMGAYESKFLIGLRLSAVDVYWNSVNGRSYQVKSCVDLGNPVWLEVGSVTATGTSCYLTDWIRDGEHKFYTISELP